MTTLEDRRTPVVDRLRVRCSWWRSRDRRATLHTRPLLAPVLGGRHRLPGLAAETVLYEAVDPYRRPCGLVLVPSTGHVSLTLGLAPPAIHAAWVADLGSWLALLAHEVGLVHCAVVIRRRAGRTQVLVQPTWHTAGPEGRTDPAALAVEVCARAPRLVQSLAHRRIGAARPVTAGQLAAVVHDAYHPGTDAAGGRQPWSQAAPALHSDRWQHLLHGGAASLTLSMSRVPPDVVLEGANALVRAVTGADDDARTRVTLNWSPDDATLSSLVTITSPGGPDDLHAATEAVLAGLPAAWRPWLRPLYGCQAAAFGAALPSGVLLAEHAAPPTLLAGTE